MEYVVKPDARCVMIGFGSWATAIVKILHENEPTVGWYVADPEVLGHIRDHGNNPQYLSDVRFDTSRLQLFGDINEAVEAADIVFLCVPSAFVQSMLQPLTASLDGKFVVSAIKGIIPGDYLTIAEYVNRRYGVGFERVGIISGPSHSEEVALSKLTYLTMASKYVANAEVLCSKFRNHYVHANPSTDIYGTEYAAVLKNIYAICAGMALGVGYGDNFMAVLVSNGSMEMNRFMAESYPFPRDTSASAYLGDLLVTCYSRFSRNRTFGTLIGEGKSVREATDSMSMVAEGYYASACIRHVNAAHGIEMPIADCVYRVLYEGSPVADEIRALTEKLL